MELRAAGVAAEASGRGVEGRMKTASRTVTAVSKALVAEISEAVQLMAEVEERAARLKTLKANIRTGLESAGLDRFATPEGAEALLVEKTNLRWDTDKLADVLKRNEYDELCPRKAEGEKLRKLLDSLEPERAKALRSCAKGSNSSALEIRAAAAVDATLN